MNLERLTTPNIVHDGSMQMSFPLSPSGNCLGNDQVGMQTNVSRSATNISWWAEDLPQIGASACILRVCQLIRLWIFSHLQNVGLLRPVRPLPVPNPKAGKKAVVFHVSFLARIELHAYYRVLIARFLGMSAVSQV